VAGRISPRGTTGRKPPVSEETMQHPDFIVHQLAGVLRVADLVAYRRAPAPRVSLKTPVAVRYLADLTDTAGR
jgi:hypothetical protein